jgi:diacylglycerol O-acyltransferase / wax synthase
MVDQLSSLDASFLHLETPETPMHVGSLMLLDKPEDYRGDYFDDVKTMVGKRLHISPVLDRKLAPMPFELAEPVWIDDDDIDLDYHVRSMTLRRPGTMAQLETLVSRLHSSLLDRSRPLWELYIIEGLESGQAAIYTKVHHSGIDGKAGAEFIKTLYDSSPQMREVRPPRRKYKSGRYQLGVNELLQAAAANAAVQQRKAAEMWPAASQAYRSVAIMIEKQAAKEGRHLNLGYAPKSVFNQSITNQRSFSTMSVSLAEIKALGKRIGGTVNTIVMAMCSIALDRFLRERDLLPKEALIAQVPVSLRAEGDSAMNNQVTMVRVDLATDISDLQERFKAIHASSEAAKAVVRELKPFLSVEVPVTGSPWLVTGLASLIGRSNLLDQVPSSSNVLISNVPGPSTTHYVAGARVLHYYPVSIPYHGSALNMTVQSYAGLLEFGLTACRRVLSQEESHELIEHLKAALHEIEALPAAEGSQNAEVTARAPNESGGTSNESKPAA